MSKPLRAALYARYSTDKQRDASIEDQLRVCRALAIRQGYDVVEVYSDRATSGASLMRPGIQRLLQDARSGGRFDVVIAHALDRLSRNQADIASLYQTLQFLRIPIETVSEGPIEELHIGLKGTMNALFLKDLAKKTREGLRGRALAGKSAGGLTYGYRAVRRYSAEGEPIRGDREIHPEEAAVVERIMRAYAEGLSPKKIAEMLNLEGIAAPREKYWSASTIHGNRERGTGILNNELYVGKQVWNRLTYAKDPETGKRISRLNPEEAWEITDVPDLRIIDDDLWQAVRARQGALKSKGTDVPIWDRRRPKYLLSGLMVCGCCGAGFAKVGRDGFGCSGARNKGRAVCTNMTVIKKDDLEGRVLHALQHHLMDDAAVKVFCEEYTAERNRLAKAADAGRAAREKDLREVTGNLDKLVDALLAGVPAARVKDRMEKLEAQKTELEAQLAAAPAPSSMRYHPSMAGAYRVRIRDLIAALSTPDHASEAKETLRALIEKIVLRPVPSATAKGGVELVADLHGSLAGLLRVATGQPVHAVRRSTAGPGAPETQLVSSGPLSRPQAVDIMEELVLVAGVGFEPTTFRL
ncbi:recombinase family protein [Rhodobacter aestuarii]|uniref:recombinase family protein n=1 Tax=Rhodobacter aestuarii TaxID=453582 RepID=UPI0009709291|nr:recombinase family protein [Rhodobacter aestuarii]